MMRRGDHLLSETRLADLDLVSYQYPYYLYTPEQVRRKSAALVHDRYYRGTGVQVPLGSPPEQQAYKDARALFVVRSVMLSPGSFQLVRNPLGPLSAVRSRIPTPYPKDAEQNYQRQDQADHPN